MSPLYIIGAGGFGREVLAWLESVPVEQRDWKLAGFLDANPDALNRFRVSHQIVGDPDVFGISPHHRFICAIGDPGIRLALTTKLEQRGARFISFIHPSAIIGPRVEIGEGSVVCPGSVLSCDIQIGKHVGINMSCTIGHDAVIGDGCTLSCQVDITGGVVLERGVFVGSCASILPRVRVGANAVVGAGAVVTRDVEPGTTVVGVPAKKR